MRVQNQTTSIENPKNTVLSGSKAFLPINKSEKLTLEIEKYLGKFNFAENPILTLPPKIIFSDIKTKLESGFERWIYGSRELRIYVFPFSMLSNLPQSDKLKKNSLEDIFCYRQKTLVQPSRKNFLKLVRQRFDKGMSVYTYVEDKVLQSYIWMDPNPQSYFGRGVDQNIEAIPNSVYIQDAYTNPFFRAKGLGKIGMCHIAHDAAKIPGKTCLYLATFGKNAASRHAVEKLGSIHKTSYFCQTRFGFRKTWKIEHEQ